MKATLLVILLLAMASKALKLWTGEEGLPATSPDAIRAYAMADLVIYIFLVVWMWDK